MSRDEGHSCNGFAWIGQSFATCDRCGVPFWWHTHEQRADRSRGPFDMTFENVPIDEETRGAVWRKWVWTVRRTAPDWHRRLPTSSELSDASQAWRQ